MEDSPDFLSREEKEFVVTVQEKFHEELAARKAQGKAYPCLLGSVALARILRAAEGNVEKACEWFQALLRTLSDPATDELVQDALSRFGNDSHIINASMLPHHEAISDFYHAELCAPLLSPDGDMVMYLPLVDLDRDGILEHLDWDHWVKFSRACTVMQCAALDFLSRKNQRFARMILIVDLEGMSMEGVVHRTFARAHRRDVIDSFQQRVAAEIVTSVYVVNVPWAIANLFSLCKTFIPAKFLKKVRVLSSNALKDSSFVENCGGQEQLSELFASRKGLVSSNSQRHESQRLAFLDVWPDEEELQHIQRLREKFAEQLQVREANGTAWPCFMSDVAMARVLRGNEGYLSEATNWFQKFLTKMDKWGVDEIARDVTAKMAQAERGSLTMLPHAEEVGRHFRCVFSAPRLTPAGDVIWYLPLSDFDRQGLVDQVEWKHWEEFVRAMIVLRAAEAQKLSQAQHRLAKCVTILDLHGSGIGTTGVPKVESFDEPNQKNMKFMRQIVIDILGPVYVLNAPWVAVKAFNWFKSLVPERFSRKVILLDGDGTYDDDFVEMVGEAQLKHLLATRIGLLSGETDADAGECSIGAGESLNKCRDLKCGETIAWSFTVESGDADGWLGVSDIVFSAKMMFHPDFNREEVEEEGQGTLALEETTVQASNGQVTGKYTAARDGVVTLCWSNEHSRMRTKGVQFQIDLQR
ncbi:unnamed protein product [Effrenium voratum]|uniref:CRAL-TRIO domain-containing protein n=1 Tax=Effrenium voratum TaxID=2562239 RepID=A0AA36HSY8_9DINO|nr:unnamed protein product [Effrenium voratum]CAJ1417884.1 unnamed protein product [Effrenium voratum]